MKAECGAPVSATLESLCRYGCAPLPTAATVWGGNEETEHIAPTPVVHQPRGHQKVKCPSANRFHYDPAAPRNASAAVISRGQVAGNGKQAKQARVRMGARTYVQAY